MFYNGLARALRARLLLSRGTMSNTRSVRLALAPWVTLVLAIGVITCRNDDGSRAPTESAPFSPSFSVSASAVTLVGAGDIANCSHHNDTSTAKLLDTIPGTVFTTGDNAAPTGGSGDYATCYNPTWGR